MYHIEEVIVGENSTEYVDTEYLTEPAEHPSSVQASKGVPVKILPKGITIKRSTLVNTKPILQQRLSSGVPMASSTEVQPQQKRKVPIVRMPGEVVTPTHMRVITSQTPVTQGNVATDTTATMETKPMISVPEVRIKAGWNKIPPPGLKIPLKSNDSDNEQEQQEMLVEEHIVGQQQHVGGEVEVVNEYAVTANEINMEFLLNKLHTIEQKLDLLLSRSNETDAMLKMIKYNVKDLKQQQGGRPLSYHTPMESNSYESAVAVKRDRKRLVLFPVCDDNYLLRLEELIQADDDIRDEVLALFSEAPNTSVYEFMRKNIQNLFKHTSKYTWTGKPPNNLPMVPSTNAANKLSLVELLVTCGNEHFPNTPRDSIEKEFRRALTNFNDAKQVREKRHLNRSTTNQIKPTDNYDSQ